MSVMKFREPNQVLWRGWRPGHNGTQIAKRAAKSNGTLIVHTVTAGKTFFLSHWRFRVDTTAAAHSGLFFVRDTDDITVYDIDDILMRTVGHYNNAVALFHPIEIPAGYDVCISSSDAALSSSAFIHGWEE